MNKRSFEITRNIALPLAMALSISACSTMGQKEDENKTVAFSMVEDSRAPASVAAAVIEDVVVGLGQSSKASIGEDAIRAVMAEKFASPQMAAFRSQFNVSSFTQLLSADASVGLEFLRALGKTDFGKRVKVTRAEFQTVMNKVVEASKSGSLAYADMKKVRARIPTIATGQPILGDKSLDSDLKRYVGPEEAPRLVEAARRLEQAVIAADAANRDKMLKISRRLIANAIKIYQKMGTQVLGEGCALTDDIAMENLDKWIDGVESKVSSGDNTRSLVRKMGDELKALLGLPSTQAAYERIAALSGNQCRTINGKAIGRDLASEMVSSSQ